MGEQPAPVHPFILFIRLTRPIFLLGGILLYMLGVGMVHYLGLAIDWTTFWLGLGCVVMIQMSAQYLNEYFDLPADANNPNRTLFTGGSGLGEGKGLGRATPLLAALATLTVATVLIYALFQLHHVNQVVGVVFVLAILGSVFYSVPPLRLVGTGYGELTASILVANLVPAFAYLLQTGAFHRLLAMTTFPLTSLHLAMLIAFSLPDYSNDLKYNKRTLLIRLGWQRAMNIHNLLIGLAYLLLMLAIVEGLPLRLAWPGFLSMPIGIFQIWQMTRIASGGPTRWQLLTFTSLALFGVTAYLLAFSYWTG
ncbi:MAG: prenyltransferase [Chloroflexi bacterium]|nr:prenyltransferase [Chloroflexota bacterium]